MEPLFRPATNLNAPHVAGGAVPRWRAAAAQRAAAAHTEQVRKSISIFFPHSENQGSALFS